MPSKETKKRIRDEVRADKARYDDVTRRLEERIERGLREMDPRRRSRLLDRELARYDDTTRRLKERIERGRREMNQRRARRESS
jgi:hypothetical protein